MVLVCSQCRKEISRHNTGYLCPACQEKRLEKMITDDEYFIDAKGYANLLGLDSAEQLRRLARKGVLAPRIPGIKQWRWHTKDVEDWYEQEQRAGDVFRKTARVIASNLKVCNNPAFSVIPLDKIGGRVYGEEEYVFGVTATGQVEPIELLKVDRSLAVKMLKQLPKKYFPELTGINDWTDLTYGQINEDLIIRLDTYF